MKEGNSIVWIDYGKIYIRQLKSSQQFESSIG